MSREDRERGAAPDDALRGALLAATPRPPFDEVDWDGLYGRVMARARSLRPRAGIRWWHIAAGWAARGVPVTATAAAALALALGVLHAPGRSVGPDAPATAARLTVEDALAEEAGPLLSAASEDDVLANVILYDEAEGR